MKRYWLLAAFGCACLSFAAIWLGGLNQDEGWYLYAANLVHEGQRVYRDFAFTQGPVMPNVYAAFTWIWTKWGLLGARAFTLALGLLGIVFAALTARNLVLSASCLVLGEKGERGERGEKGEKGERARVGNMAALMVAMLLGCNLYHLYYLAIPKTYALASLYVIMGFGVLAARVWDVKGSVRSRAFFALIAGYFLARAAGVRISLGAILPVVGVMMLIAVVRGRATLPSVIGFGVGGLLGLFTAYGFVLFDVSAMKGFMAAQQYHAARGGFDLTWVVGSLSRLVRWYLPVFIVLGLAVTRQVGGGRWKVEQRTDENSSVQPPTPRIAPPSELASLGGYSNLQPVILLSFLAVFVVQMAAPFPYEDYQVPIMGLLAVYAAVNFVDGGQRFGRFGSLEGLEVDGTAKQPTTNTQIPKHPNIQTPKLLLVLGLCFASSFGSPLLEKWMTNGQDRFWSLKKEKCELAQLRDAAKKIEEIDPNGKEIFTQDLYLAIESHRKVPKGLEMGPFSILTDAEWRELISSAPCKVAAVSGYTFAIEPPKCNERPMEQQLEYLRLLKKNYEAVDRMADFGQNATTLLLLKRKEGQRFGGLGGLESLEANTQTPKHPNAQTSQQP